MECTSCAISIINNNSDNNNKNCNRYTWIGLRFLWTTYAELLRYNNNNDTCRGEYDSASMMVAIIPQVNFTLY